MTTRTGGRHRAPARAKAPNTSHQTFSYVTGSVGTVAKTSAVIAVSGGLVASLGMQANAATPTSAPAGTSSTSHRSSAASAVPGALTRGVSAAPHFGQIGFTATAKPKPKPVVHKVRRSTERVSRSSSRTAISTDAPKTVAAGAPGSSQFGAAVMSIAARYEGVEYRYGGTTPAGFDCSGYTQYVFRQVGIHLPRTSSAQRSATRRISRSEAVPGDLVFMPGHVGIYAGNGMMWDSPRSGESIHKRAVYSSSATYGRVG